MAIHSLDSKQVYRQTRLAQPTEDILSSHDFAPIDEILGQQRARQALEFAMSIKDKGYNIYAIGENGLGKRTMILRYLNSHNSVVNPLYDWCYIKNFDEERCPSVLKLPQGSAKQFKKAIESLLNKLVKALPLAFDNDMYHSRADQLKNQLSLQQETLMQELSDAASQRHIALTISTLGDYQLTAMQNEEEAHTEESYDALSESDQVRFEQDIQFLEKKLRRVIRTLTEWEDEFSDKQKEHDDQVAKGVLSHYLRPLKKRYRDQEAVHQFITALGKDILENLDLFLDASEEEASLAIASLEKKLPRRYQVNVLVSSHADQTLPVIVEDNPSYHSLFGYIENASFKGTVFTDFSLIRPGSLHKANGGVLLMDAAKVLERPYVWDGLKRALRSKQLDLSSLEREVSLSGAISLAPEPIPLEVKIILFGDRQTYQLLQHYDPDFSELFRVTADFEHSMERTENSESQYAKFIASIVQENQMLPCSLNAMERVVEFSSRRAGHQDKISLYSVEAANLLREANYFAQSAAAEMIESEHIAQAISARDHRVSRMQSHIMESFKDGTTLIQVSGTKVGQVNALSVLSSGDHEFGVPNRITATTACGKGEILDIENKVKLSGSIHSKGVYILSAYLNTMLAKEQRLPINCHMTFEQSYGGIDGDSASMAECCAILSAISERPIFQHLAITGSMDQFGESQPIGGVNEKIEGFFDVCQLKGRNEQQGVIIPHTNIANLMLRQDIVDEIAAGRFHIWSVSNVMEAMSLLSGTSLDANDELHILALAQAKLSSVRAFQASHK
ncbi:Lon protease family protein [Shewanella sp. NIFS-20-20]|uniref:Lon protease family protein n=1 Tax=Shewanella sp. NIFS-20-20 TaxID=2853806 RepID=UPI001C44C871|nr:ATP-binding protein [Shewanella sp. NIFS-20-20]MBV7316501.1 AAA family ATPase [Shewanella sp. NIFS-20-20]